MSDPGRCMVCIMDITGHNCLDVSIGPNAPIVNKQIVPLRIATKITLANAAFGIFLGLFTKGADNNNSSSPEVNHGHH